MCAAVIQILFLTQKSQAFFTILLQIELLVVPIFFIHNLYSYLVILPFLSYSRNHLSCVCQNLYPKNMKTNHKNTQDRFRARQQVSTLSVFSSHHSSSSFPSELIFKVSFAWSKGSYLVISQITIKERSRYCSWHTRNASPNDFSRIPDGRFIDF